LINTCASKVQPTSAASKLAELIIQVYSATNETPTEVATNLLKKEVRSFM